MKTTFSKTLLALAFACGIALAPIGAVPVWGDEDNASTGTAGTNGANGASGNPAIDGANGGNGGIANAEAISLSGNATARAFGGVGGKGGNGGNGIGSNVDGGQGGNGGRGGRAEAMATTTAAGGKAFARSVGGRGGNGGEGGNASSGGIPGFGGYGGQGGFAMSQAFGVRSATAIAVGGRSGTSGGKPFSTSFPGGGASAFAQAINNAGPVTVIARQFGGNGGNSGGRGASSHIQNGVVGTSSSNLVFEQSARGGHGGNGPDAPGGNGGHASSGFNQNTLSGVNYVNGTVVAIGGNGGESALKPYSAGHGGNASVAFFNNSKNQGIFLRALGGHGGDHLSGRLAGNGGNANLTASTISVQNGGEIDLRGLFVGGNGGSTAEDAKLNLARGGQALVNNTLNINSDSAPDGANMIRGIFNLRGGQGGAFGDVNKVDRYVGLAGSAIGRFTDSANATNKHFRVNAFGGAGADFVKSDPDSDLDWAGGNGAKAEVDITSVNAKGNLLIEANAFGGNTGQGGMDLFSPLGFLGFGGEAIAKGHGTTSSLGSNVTVVSKSIGGLGLNSATLNGGGGAKSYATAIGTSDNTAIARAFATATNSSDTAYTNSNATSAGGSANALASSDGRPDAAILDVLGTIAEANSNAEAVFGDATANSTAVSGNLQNAFSTSNATGISAMASATSVGGNSLWSLNGIRGGNANSAATAHSDNLGVETNTIAMAMSKAGDIDMSTGITGIGGFSVANANASSDSVFGANVLAIADSVAGKGSNFLEADGRDGRADALATATLAATKGHTHAHANAESTHFGNAVANAHGGETATATAEVTLGGGGFARSFSSSENFESAMSHSIARFVGPSTTLGSQRGTVLTEASTKGEGVNVAKLRVSGILDAFDADLVNFGAAQAIVGHRRDVADVLGIVVEPSAAFSHYQLAPSADLVDTFMAGSPSVKDEFNQVLGVGVLGNTTGIDTSFRSFFELSMDVMSMDTEVRVGFFGAESTGVGFDTLRLKMWLEGNMVMDELFMDVASADAFFADNVVSIGNVADLVGPMDLEIEWLMNTNAASSYLVNLAFGTGSSVTMGMMSIPEPGALAFLMLCGVGLTMRRKRRHC